MPLTNAQVRNARYNPERTGNRLADGGRITSSSTSLARGTGG
ncbi:hypothetical protein P3T21_000715 [Paraburkholderia sp. GAS334]